MIGITGATGFVGMTHLAYCLRKGLKVRILVRPGHPYSKNPPANVQVTVGDLGDLRSLADFAEGLEVCFHYAARASFKGDWTKFEVANVFGTENLVTACQEVPRVIYCSTQAVVLEDRDIVNADETLPYPNEFMDYYARSKAMAEQIVLANHPGGTVVRPPWVWGAGDTNNLPTLIKPTLDGRMGYFDGGTNLLETLHVGNLVYGSSLLAESDETRQKVYFVTDDKPVRSKDFSNAIIEACGLDAVHRSYPSKVVRAVLWTEKALGKKKVSIPRSSFIYMTREQTFSDEAIRRTVCFEDAISREDGLKDLSSWCEAIGGAESLCAGRRRGQSTKLIADTWAYLLEPNSFLKKLP